MFGIQMSVLTSLDDHPLQSPDPLGVDGYAGLVFTNTAGSVLCNRYPLDMIMQCPRGCSAEESREQAGGSALSRPMSCHITQYIC